MIQVRYFARYREHLGLDAETLEVTGGSVAAVQALLVARGGAWAVLAEAGTRCALNQVLCHWDAQVSAGDEVAFFPRMTGG